ncbi:hypothetical protein RJ639_011815 [Escallonia herrerae]|uniref:Chromo domain-containing protein n=1 Tax=Escallonia herrerae TaxID=1293975 RepID=A0AA89APX6_9ASTE|nr:hypothetical protein RJ639_011815 [Escallonia herrerae]
MQECHPVAYESRKLNEAERRYTTHEKELLMARHYLLGSSFIVRTDNTVVSHFLSQSKLTSKQARWQELLAEFNFMLEYRAGSTNSVVDALSRRAKLDQIAELPSTSERRSRRPYQDPVAQQLLKLIESGKTQQFWQEDGLLMTKGRRVYVPRVDDLRRTLIREYHDTFWPGHAGGKRTLAFLQQGKNAFEIVNGQQQLLPHTVNVPNAGKSPWAISFSEEWRQNIDLAHPYLEKAARRIKKHADKNRRSQEFNVGDRVMVKLLPQDRKFLRGRDSHLLQKYEGPLTIVKKIGKMAYKVDPPPLVEPQAPSCLSPSRKRHQKYLVKWQGHMDEENTWERAANLSAYADKIEAYHMQKLTRALTALVGENVTGCPLHPPSTAPWRPSSSAPPRPSNRHPCALASSSSLAPMRPSSTAPARPIVVPAQANSQP